jgi:hypothetical protein
MLARRGPRHRRFTKRHWFPPHGSPVRCSTKRPSQSWLTVSRKRLDIDVQYECEVARDPDADRNAKVLIDYYQIGVANFDA